MRSELRDDDLSAAVKVAFILPSRTQMPRHVNNGDSLRFPSQKCSLQPGSALIVEEVLIPMFFHQLRNDYGDLAVRILPFKIQNVLHDRTDDEAIRRIQKS